MGGCECIKAKLLLTLFPPRSPQTNAYSRSQTQDTAGGASASGLQRSMSGGSSVSHVTGGSGTTSKYSNKVLLISAEEFDMTLEGVEMSSEWVELSVFSMKVKVASCVPLVSTAARAGASSRAPHPPPAGIKRQWMRFQYRVRLMVEAPLFNNLFLVAILANTVLLAVEHDGMSPE